MSGLFNFLLFLLDQEQRDNLWDIWLNRMVESDFPTFEKKHYKPIRQKKAPVVSHSDQESAIALASQFIKPVNEEGGEKHDDE